MSNGLSTGRTAVIGLGLMGRSIATCLLSSGFAVIGVTDNLQASAGVPERLRQLLTEMFAEGFLSQPVDSLMSQFCMSDNLEDIAGAEIAFDEQIHA